MNWIEPDWPAPGNVRALSTTRDGGLSEGVFAGLNLGAHVGDEPARVEANRARLHRLAYRMLGSVSEAEDAVQDTAGVTVTVMQGAKSESVKINSSVSQQDGGVVLSAALTGSDWQVGKAELTIRLSETEYDCCLPVSALHSDNGGDFVYSVEERNTILGLQNIVRKVYVEVVERNNELAALRNYTTGAPVVAATTKSLQEGARVRTAG